MIKLGLYSSIANPPRGDDLDRCVQEAIAEAELAEACGFHGFFFGEHHQDRDGFLPSPLIVCSAVAARTKRIQIGTSVLLLPLHHPLRVAEDVATLDIISGGRFALGIGMGIRTLISVPLVSIKSIAWGDLRRQLKFSINHGAANGSHSKADILTLMMCRFFLDRSNNQGPLFGLAHGFRQRLSAQGVSATPSSWGLACPWRRTWRRRRYIVRLLMWRDANQKSS